MILDLRERRVVCHTLIDTNYWKSFMYACLAVAIGDHGCLSLFGQNPGRLDNHWLDCLVGCAMAASMLGVRVPGQDAKPLRKRYIQEDLRKI